MGEGSARFMTLGGEKMVGIKFLNAKGSREKVAVNFLGFHVQHM